MLKRAVFLALCLASANAIAAPTQVLYAEQFMANCPAAGAVLTAPVTCGGATGVSTKIVNAITFFFDFQRGTADGYQCNFEYFSTLLNKWSKGATQKINSGSVVVSPAVYSRTVAVSEVIKYDIAVSADAVRLVCSALGTPNASDKLSVVARVSYTPDI